MTRPRPLPEHLGREAFDRTAARRSGVKLGRLRRKDVARPYYGVHMTATAETVHDRCRAYSVRLKPGQFFTHGTAAILLGFPLPAAVEQDAMIHVGAAQPADAPHSRGVVGHRLVQVAPTVEVEGLPVVDLAEAFCQLGGLLTAEDLVVVADHLLNVTVLDERATKALLHDRIGVLRRMGGARLRSAVDAARTGSGSPAETRVRLVLDAGRVPPPELNVKLFDDRGRYLGKPDFVWRAQKVVLEYEGDGHREQSQFRYDIARYDRLAAAGWRVLRATADDLTAEGRRSLVRRVNAALA